MVKSQALGNSNLDNIFSSLSDPTRRKIIEMLSVRDMTVGEIKAPFRMSLVAVSKHLKVLEKAKLIRRQKMGREHIIKFHPQPLKDAYRHLEIYKPQWMRQLDAMEKFLERNS
ncbi:MAG TPA: metalloregulator ArsR/SmtB family transcription factor [Patescibacteria group bacterium]|nr:metalloregulator ArsR/SmtB family transcription factor [Patescibacteria group bacterium]